MVEWFRKNARNGVLVAVLAVVLVSFVFFGATRLVTLTPRAYVLKVGGQSIDSIHFERMVDRFVRFFSRNPSLREQLNAMTKEHGGGSERALIKRYLLGQLTGRFAFLNYYHSLGMDVGMVSIARTIAHIPFLQTNGKFDSARFAAFLHDNQWTEEEYRQLIGNQLLTSQFASLFEEIPFPQALGTVFAKTQNAKWTIAYKKIPLENFRPTVAPSDDELKAYYRAHIAAYRIPESRRITGIFVTKEDLARNTKVTKKQVEQTYKRHLSAFAKPEKRKFSYLVFQDEVTARAALVVLRAKGGSLKKVKGKYHVVDFEATKRGDIPIAAVAKIVFSTPKGKYAGPVHLANGYAVVRVNGIVPKRIPPLSAVYTKVKKLAKRDVLLSRYEGIRSQVSDGLATGISLGVLSKQVGLPLKTVNEVGIGKKSPTLTPSESRLLGNPAILGALAQTVKGQTTGVLSDQGGKDFLVAKVDSVTKTYTPPLGDPKTKKLVIANYQNAKAKKAAEARAKIWVSKLSASKKLGSLTGGEKTLQVRLTSKKQTPLQQLLIQSVYSQGIPIGGAAYTIVGDQLYVFQVRNVVFSKVTSYAKIRAGWRTDVSTILFGGMQRLLINRYRPKVRERLFEQS